MDLYFTDNGSASDMFSYNSREFDESLRHIFQDADDFVLMLP